MATIEKNFVPLEPIHPTELIKDELKARGMQRKELADLLGMKNSNLSRLISAKEEITPSLALKLENALGIPAEFWLELQVSYEKDLEVLRPNDNYKKRSS